MLRRHCYCCCLPLLLSEQLRFLPLTLSVAPHGAPIRAPCTIRAGAWFFMPGKYHQSVRHEPLARKFINVMATQRGTDDEGLKHSCERSKERANERKLLVLICRHHRRQQLQHNHHHHHNHCTLFVYAWILLDRFIIIIQTNVNNVTPSERGRERTSLGCKPCAWGGPR